MSPDRCFIPLSHDISEKDEMHCKEKIDCREMRAKIEKIQYTLFKNILGKNPYAVLEYFENQLRNNHLPIEYTNN
jgi:hypothetical protein